MEKKRKVVIIEIQHLSALYQALSLKFNKYNRSDVILFVNKDSFIDLNFTKNLIKNNIFVKVVCFSEPGVKFNKPGIEAVDDFFDPIFLKNHISFDDISEIVTACDVQNLFSIYCLSHGKKVDFIELYSNQFRDRHRYCTNREQLGSPLWVEELSLQYEALNGSEKFSNNRYLFPDSKIEYIGIDKHVNFLEEYFNLEKKYKDLIVDCLEIKDKIKYNNFNLLLLNSSGWNQHNFGLGGPQHYIPYLLIADYYFNDDKDKTLMIKNHPQTTKENFIKYVEPYSNTMDAEIPIEIFAIIDRFKINKLVSVNSTGNDKIQKYVNRQVKLGNEFCLEWKNLHKLFYALKLKSELFNLSTFHCFDINCGFVSNLISFAFEKLNGQEIKSINPRILKWDIFAIIGTVKKNQYEDLRFALVNSDLGTKVIFLNVDISSFLNLDNLFLLEYIIPIKITKKKLRNDTLSDNEIETLYFFCKDEFIRNQVNEFKFEKELRTTGIKVSAYPIKETELEIFKLNLKSDILTKKLVEHESIFEGLKNVMYKGENK